MPDPSPTPNSTFRVLVVVSRPLDLDELPTIADQWALLKGLATVKAPVSIQVVRPPTIQQFGLEFVGGYDIVHFDGHGALGVRCPNCTALNSPECQKCERCDASLEGETCRSYLVFEKEDGAQDAMAAEELVERICGIPDSPTKLVFLSACESAAGGEKSLTSALLKGGIPCILAMNEVVSVDVTKALSSAFYAALGAGMTIAEAFKFAVPALSRLPDRPETGTKARDIPVLLGEGAKERLVTSLLHGSVTMNQERLPGVPEYDFIGEYIRDNPPRGRKGLLLQIVQALLGGEKLVVLTGQGGIGKSVLASVAARRISWQYPGGVFWRSAADMETLGLNELLDAFSSIFGYEFRTLSLEIKRDAVLSYLGDLETPSLIVVDNAERVNDPALWSFLEGLPQHSAALVASREALTREGLHIHVPKMEYEESIGIFEEEEEEGHFKNKKPGLFISASRRANNQKWGERLDREDMDILEEIDLLLDGHPLGIKLAAALTASDSLWAICEKLRAAPPKEVSDRFDFSYNTLTGSQKNLLHRMAAFASSVEEWAIDAICTEHIFEEDEAELLPEWRNDLSELVRKSFVDTQDIHRLDELENEVSVPRYKLHPLMRQYAVIKAGDLAMRVHSGRSAHLFLEFAEQEENYYALESEHANILAGEDWLYEEKEWELVKRFAVAIEHYLDLRGYWKDAALLLEREIEANRELGDKSGMASSIHKLGILTQKTGDMNKARSLFQRCLKIRQELKDKESIAHTLWQLGSLASEMGNFDEAKRLLQEQLEIDMELGDRCSVVQSLVELGGLALKAEDTDEAQRLYKECSKVSKDIGEEVDKAIAFHNLGMFAYYIGDRANAKRYLQKSLKISQDLNDEVLSAQTLKQIGIVVQAGGDILKARKFYKDSLDIRQNEGDKMEIASLLYHLATLAQMSGDVGEAKKLHQRCLKIFQEIGNKKEMAKSMSVLGELAFNADDFDEARTYLLDSLKIYQEIGDKGILTDLLRNLGLIAEKLKDINEAEQFYNDGLRISKEIGDGCEMSNFLHRLGVLAQDSGDNDKAERLYKEGLKISKDIGDEKSVEDFEYHLEILTRN